MPIAIKNRAFSLDKQKLNGTFRGPNDLGWAPGYESKHEGYGIDKKKFDKNFDKIDWSK